ncbi:MAG: 30S ribosomal protein S17 [Candidatus Moranbacteria bacterium]|jgi:small subunit ribosomal protein S17|nr:30S ribosomal protein S17 [Candidatus Moranbacteria bacterium]NTW90173.1 30S ribosomal protein S17 [Candidatus Moranbacteria bacterium]
MATTKQTTEQTTSKAPTLRGTVTSAKAAKTITVEVKTLKVHPKYGKRYRSSKKYLVHAPEGTYAEGDTVTFRECRPLSSRKRHEVVTDAK